MIAVVLGFYWVLLGRPDWFDRCGLSLMRGTWFMDTWAVLAASDVAAAGQDPFGANSLWVQHLYPRAWFGLATLGVDRGDFLWIGLGLVLVFLGASLIWLRPRTWMQAASAVCLLGSPAVALGFNRANTDLLIFLLMLLLVVTTTARSRLVRGLAPAWVVAGALLKFYPVFAAAGIWFWSRTRRELRGQAAWLFGLLAVVTVPLAQDYARVATGLPEGFGLFKFGAYPRPGAVPGWSWMPWCLLAVAGVWGWRRGMRGPAEDVGAERVENGFAVGMGLLAGCFLAGGGYLYRLVFALLLVPWLWSRGEAGRPGRWLARVGLWGAAGVAWFGSLVSMAAFGLVRAGSTVSAEMILGSAEEAGAALQWLWMGVLVVLWAEAGARKWRRFQDEPASHGEVHADAATVVLVVRDWRGAIRAALPSWASSGGVLAGYWVLLSHPDWLDWCALTLYRGNWFGDTWVLLAASDLRAAGLDPYGPNPFGLVHVYPRVWFGLADLGLNRGDFMWLGLLIGLVFLGASLWWLRPRRWGEAAAALALLCSPAFILGFNRANNDLIILLLMMGLTTVLAARSSRIRALGPALVAMGALLKFYPVLAGLGVVFGRGSWREKVGQGVVLTGLCALLAGPLREDYALAVKGVPQAPGFYKFGAVLSPFSGVGLAAWAALMAAVVWGWRRGGGSSAGRAGLRDEIGFVIGVGLVSGCFLAGVSYVYRLVFIILMFPWLWDRIRSRRQWAWAWAAVWGGVAVVWLDFFLMLGTVGSLLGHKPDWAAWIQAESVWFRLPLQWAWVAVLLFLLAGLARSLREEKRGEVTVSGAAGPAFLRDTAEGV